MTATADILTLDFSNPDVFAPVYIPLINANIRTRVVYGGRGSAKTHHAILDCVMDCLRLPYFKCLMVRKMAADIKESIYSNVKRVIIMYGLEKYFRFMDGECKIICLLNGNTFIKQGIQQTSSTTGKAKGKDNPTHALVDEADELELDEYLKLSLSLRVPAKYAHVVKIKEYLLFNPTDEEHWIVTYFFPANFQNTWEKQDGSHTYLKSKISNAVILHTTYLMNPFADESFIEQMQELKKADPDKYLQSGLGLIMVIKSGEEALKKFKKTKHVKNGLPFKIDQPVIIHGDYNKRPHHTFYLSQCLYSDDEKSLDFNIFREYTLKSASIEEVIREICFDLKQIGWTGGLIRYMADFYGKSTTDVHSQSLEARALNEIKRTGFNYKNESVQNPPVEGSCQFVDQIFAGGIRTTDREAIPGASVNINIAKQCSFLITDISKTKIDNGKLVKTMKTEKVIEGGVSVKVSYQLRGHGVDALRYGVIGALRYLFKLFTKAQR